MSGGYFEPLRMAGRLIDDHRTTDAATRFHSFLGNIQHVSNRVYAIMCVFACVCVCVCVLHGKTKKTKIKYYIEYVKIFVVVEIHNKTQFHFHSSVHSH